MQGRLQVHAALHRKISFVSSGNLDECMNSDRKHPTHDSVREEGERLQGGGGVINDLCVRTRAGKSTDSNNWHNSSKKDIE